MAFTYPAFFKKEGEVYNIEFPDFPEIKIFSTSSNEAINLANKSLDNQIISLILENKELPQATPIENLYHVESNVTIVLVRSSNMSELNHNYIKKTLTIPEWVNTLATKHNFNFSQILTNALIEKIGEFYNLGESKK